MASVEELVKIAREVRVLTIKELRVAQSGHPGSSLSALDVMVATYFGGEFKTHPDDPVWEDRDYFVLSVGHAVPGLYATLARAGYGPLVELNGLRKFGTRLAGHAKRNVYPGVEVSAGSLGQGLGVGLGICLGLRVAGKSNRVVVLMSDGEQQEGSTWESVMLAGSKQPTGLVAIIDKNSNQINGPTHEIMPVMDELPSKYRAFGWECLEINGNEMVEVNESITYSLKAEHPVAIVSHTTTGAGISYMEGDFHWHHGVISDTLFIQAMQDLGQKVSPAPDETWAPEFSGQPE